MSQITAQELPSPHTMSQLASLLPETSTRSCFPFLKLPAEIRNMIYLLLLSKRSIHILSSQPHNNTHDSQSPTNHAFRDTNSHIDGQSSGNGDDSLSISILLARKSTTKLASFLTRMPFTSITAPSSISWMHVPLNSVG